MTKVAYSFSSEGFRISEKARNRMIELGLDENLSEYDISTTLSRHDPILIQVIEELGSEANGKNADLVIAHVDGPYRIDEYDGVEYVMTPEDYQWITP